MTAEQGGGVFFKFPVRYPAVRADLYKPLVSQPSGSPAVQGVGDVKLLVAVGDKPCLIAVGLNGADTVELTGSGGPQLDLVDQLKELYPFAVKPFFWRGSFIFFQCHGAFIP